MVTNLLVFGAILAGAALLGILAYAFSRNLISVEDLAGADWAYDRTEFDGNVARTVLTSDPLTLVYTEWVDSSGLERVIRITMEVSSRERYGKVEVDISGGKVLGAGTPNVNYRPLACQWAYDLKAEVEKVINDHRHHR